jgi:hypothetical protein
MARLWSKGSSGRQQAVSDNKQTDAPPPHSPQLCVWCGVCGAVWVCVVWVCGVCGGVCGAVCVVCGVCGVVWCGVGEWVCV